MGHKAAHVLYELLGMPEKVCAVGSAWTAPKYQNSLEILGTEGCFYQIDDKVFCRKGTEAWKEIPKEQLPEPMVYPLTDWAKHILNGTKSGLHGVEEAAAIVKMLTAAYRSKGNMVSVKD